MEVLIWLQLIIISFFMGYHISRFNKRIEVLEKTLKQKVDKKPDDPVSEVIDPYDDIQTAKYEHDKLMKKLNP